MICPNCKNDLDGDLIYDTFLEKYGDHKKALETAAMYGANQTEGRWGRQIGIETEEYDGVSYWKCPDCNALWSRWTGQLIDNQEDRLRIEGGLR